MRVSDFSMLWTPKLDSVGGSYNGQLSRLHQESQSSSNGDSHEWAWQFGGLPISPAPSVHNAGTRKGSAGSDIDVRDEGQWQHDVNMDPGPPPTIIKLNSSLSKPPGNTVIIHPTSVSS